MEIIWRVVSRAGEGRKWGREEGTGIKKHNGKVLNRRRDVKYRIGNGEAKKRIRTTHGHELRWEDCWREEGYWAEGGKGRKIGTTVIA